MTINIDNIWASYGKTNVLKGITLKVEKGEAVGILGLNGAGKTTLAKILSGLMVPSRGHIRFLDRDITTLPSNKRVEMGLVMIPEGHQIFKGLSVKENLLLGSYARYRKTSKTVIEGDLKYIYELFPILKERLRQKAETLSGGERRMLGIGQALMAKAKFLIIDEPSLGLAPLVKKNIFAVLKKLIVEGITILLIEQDTINALKLVQRVYVLNTGRIVIEKKTKDLVNTDEIQNIYLGKGKDI